VLTYTTLFRSIENQKALINNQGFLVFYCFLFLNSLISISLPSKIELYSSSRFSRLVSLSKKRKDDAATYSGTCSKDIHFRFKLSQTIPDVFEPPNISITRSSSSVSILIKTQVNLVKIQQEDPLYSSSSRAFDNKRLTLK